MPEYTQWKEKIQNADLLKVWQLAVDLGLKFKGKEGRYLNVTVVQNGLDFLDIAEVCCILALQELKDTEVFFNKFRY